MRIFKYTPAQVAEIIKRNCGDPPTKALLEYHVKLNEDKLEHEQKRTILPWSQEDERDLKEWLGEMVKQGKELLEKLNKE